MKPIVYDNFLDNSYNKLINETLFDPEFAWYYLENISGDKEFSINNVSFNKNQSGFNHLVYFDGLQRSNTLPLFMPMVRSIEEKFNVSVNNLSRIRIGMNLNHGESGSHYPHTDMDIPHYTLLYYVDKSDGDTIFYKGPKDNLEVDFTNPHVQNQAVLFDGLTIHSSSSPVKNSKRTTININFS